MIYLVEDDASIRELVVYALNNSGFQAAGFEAPSAFWQVSKRMDTFLGKGFFVSTLTTLSLQPITNSKVTIKIILLIHLRTPLNML